MKGEAGFLGTSPYFKFQIGGIDVGVIKSTGQQVLGSIHFQLTVAREWIVIQFGIFKLSWGRTNLQLLMKQMVPPFEIWGDIKEMVAFWGRHERMIISLFKEEKPKGKDRKTNTNTQTEKNPNPNQIL